jgi:uncharacterized caspase-like protein
MKWLSGSVFAAAMLAGVAGAAAQPAGLAVIVANSYSGFLDGPAADAEAIAGKVEESGFSTLRIMNVAGKDFAPKLDEIRKAAEAAGPFRVIYATGFGMCLNDDLMLFAEDMQPEQYTSGKVGDVVVPLSTVAEAAATGGGQVLVIFDTTPNQCTADSLKAVKLPARSALLVTTTVGGDVVDNFDETGRGAFATAFLQAFEPRLAPKDLADKLVREVGTITEDQQVPVLFGTLE